MFLEGNGALHIANTAAHSSSATCLDFNGESYRETVDGIWMTLVEHDLQRTRIS